MYQPAYTDPKEQSQIQELVRSYPFVTMISKDAAGKPFISHIPVVSEIVDNKIHTIKGHFSLRNPHVKHLMQDPKVTLIFHGPYTYISPLWYKSGRDVPTWNYCVVHVEGQLKFDSSFEDICKNLKELTFAFEGEDGWQFELPADLESPQALTSAIVAFTVVPEKITSKFKLSQNRQKIDREGVVEGLAGRTDDMSKAIWELMK